jgi:hypothetical protein
MICRRCFPALTLLLLLLLSIRSASAQTHPLRFEVGVHVASMQQRAFSESDLGFGGRFSFYPIVNLGVEFEASLFPTNLGGSVAYSRRRSEILFGIKAGQRIGKFGVFGKIRPGFINFAEAPHDVVCIAIYPPPLGCRISRGETDFALDFGGVIESYPSEHTVIRLDLGDTMIRFKGPAYMGTKRFLEGFNVHNFQLNAGFGFRF